MQIFVVPRLKLENGDKQHCGLDFTADLAGLCMELGIIYDLSIVLPGSFSRSSNPLANEENIQG